MRDPKTNTNAGMKFGEILGDAPELFVSLKFNRNLNVSAAILKFLPFNTLRIGAILQDNMGSAHSCTRVRGPPVALHVSQQISSESWGFSGVAAVSRYTPP